MTDWDGKSTLRQLQTRVADLERELSEARETLRIKTEACWSAARDLDEARDQRQVFEDHCNHASLMYREESELRQAAEARLAAVAALALCTEHGCHEKLRAALAPPAEPKS